MAVRKVPERHHTTTPEALDRPHGLARRADVDLVRIVAAVLVVAIHVSAQVIVQTHGQRLAGHVALAMNALARPGPTLFFAVAGWLLLGRRSELDETTWLARRLRRILTPLAAWSAIYICQAVVVSAIAGNRLWPPAAGPWGWLLRELTLTLAGPGIRAHLWFLYSLAMLTAAIWLVQTVGRTPARDLAIAAVAFLAALGLPGYFGASSGWAGFTWPLVYAVVGYLVLCRPARPLVGLPAYVAAAAAIFAATLAVGYDKWPDTDAGPLVFAATFGLLWTLTAVPIKKRFQPAILWLSSLTFGVYLAHPLVLDYVLLVLKPNSGSSLVVSFGLTLGGTLLLAALWHRSRTLAAVLG